MIITVVGMGKIGLPLAVQCALKGHTVFGADINQDTVNLINKGIEPFPGEMNLQEKLSVVVESEKLIASTNTVECVSKSDAVIVVVPLFVNAASEPDFSAMDSATKLIGMGLKKGTLVCYETTLPVGTTRSRFTPILEEMSSKKVGLDFNVVFSPERVLTGRIFADLRKYPKIVGGVTENCTAAGVKFYNGILEFDSREDLEQANGVWKMDSIESAEFVKLAETTYRDVNIALANEFALFASENKMDVFKVINAANSQIFSHIHKPGISVGGHCIPVYPKFYIWNNKSSQLVSAARKINESMPGWILKILEQEFTKLSEIKVLILGLSYREGVKETYLSGGIEIEKILSEKKISTFVFDPLYDAKELSERGYNPLPESFIVDLDCMVIANNDPLFIDLLKKNAPNCQLIIDGRYLLKGQESFEGVPVITLGKGVTDARVQENK